MSLLSIVKLLFYNNAEESRYLKYSVAFRYDHSGAPIRAKTKGIFTRYILFSLIVNLICAFD
jgi:hypothetical protein